jgi:stage IV sporulation protein FB
MSEFSPWCLQLGRVYRVPVRVHAQFFAVSVLALFLATCQPGNQSAGLGLMAITILFVSVLAHEMGHLLAAARLGGQCEQIVIGPLGGLGQIEVPRERQTELIMVLAGPLVNLGLVLLVLPILVLARIGLTPLASLLEPAELLQGEWWVVLLKLTFWINGMLLVANLLPAFPFDGARLLRTMLWPTLDYRSAGQVAVRTSKLTAVGICILAWLVRDSLLADVLPTWVPLALVAIWIYGSAQQEALRLDESDWDEELFNYDFSQGYTSLERNFETPRRAGSSVRRWLQQRSELRRRKRQAREMDEERQVDAILIRLHESGMQGLSAKERALLNRVSARYRNRQRS